MNKRNEFYFCVAVETAAMSEIQYLWFLHQMNAKCAGPGTRSGWTQEELFEAASFLIAFPRFLLLSVRVLYPFAYRSGASVENEPTKERRREMHTFFFAEEEFKSIFSSLSAPLNSSVSVSFLLEFLLFHFELIRFPLFAIVPRSDCGSRCIR